MLYDKLDFGFSILGEILKNSILDDEKRLGEVISETRSRGRMKLEGACHSAAVARATSYFSPTSYYNDNTGGIGYYQFLEQLDRDYADRRKEIIARLNQVMERLFTVENLLVSYTADEEGFRQLPAALRKLKEMLPEGSKETYPFTFRCV